MKSRAAEMPELAFRAFLRASGLFRHKMEPHFAQFGISGAQWGVLRAVSRANAQGHAAIRLNDLSRRLLIKPPSVTGIVDRLERLGLVERRPAAADGRAKEVALTRAGSDLVARVLEHHPAKIRSIMSGLNAAQQRDLYKLMEHFSAHLEAAEPPVSTRVRSRTSSSLHGVPR